MNYYLIKIVINEKGEDGTTIEIYNNLTSAQINYHNTLASYINEPTVVHGVVEILDTYGKVVGSYRDQVDHPAPEPNKD